MIACVKRAWFLLYAALQFVVLTTIAMHYYADGYRFTGNFLSELGMTTTWWGRPNHTSAVLFSIALATLGIAFVAFATSEPRRAARICGTLSGAAFLAVACVPVNLALDVHNALVVAAFGFLVAYAVCRRSIGYALAVVVYGIVTATSLHDRVTMVVAQKAIAYASMLYIGYVTASSLRR
jgi:uncharacterized protein (DUF486 family)